MARGLVGRLTACITPLILAGTGLAMASPASAHGFVNEPYSRAEACALGLNADCGSIAYEPQSLEAPKGFPAAGPADGRIASANGSFPSLDQQSAGRWYKNNIPRGPLTIDWTYTAAHRTSGWSYYITRPGWDPNAPLRRGDFDLIATIVHDGSSASSRRTHTIDIPADRSGYHVILAVWEVADTPNAFYNVIDVRVGGQGTAETEHAAAPIQLRAKATSASSVRLHWQAAKGVTGITGYVVLRDGVRVGTPSSTQFIDAGLTPGRTYRFEILAVDAAGNASMPSVAVTVTMASPSPTIEERKGSWSAMGRYRTGDLVTYAGKSYRCVRGYQGVGDPGWILAPSLWQRVA